MALTNVPKGTAIAGAARLRNAVRGAFGKEVRTEIEIDGTPASVWAALVDLGAYRTWNPLIRRAEGRIAVGERLKVTIVPDGGSAVTFRPTVTKVEDRREFRWLGTFVVGGVFDGEHIFTLEPVIAGRVRLVHRERFRGVLVPILMRYVERSTLRGFSAMNRALKDRVEHAG